MKKITHFVLFIIILFGLSSIAGNYPVYAQGGRVRFRLVRPAVIPFRRAWSAVSDIDGALIALPIFFLSLPPIGNSKVDQK